MNLQCGTLVLSTSFLRKKISWIDDLYKRHDFWFVTCVLQMTVIIDVHGRWSLLDRKDVTPKSLVWMMAIAMSPVESNPKKTFNQKGQKFLLATHAGLRSSSNQNRIAIYATGFYNVGPTN